MKRIALCLLFLLSVSTFCGCEEAKVENDNSGERFYRAIEGWYNDVWVDKETGVMYFYRGEGYSGGLTVMVDEDGKPLIWEGN